jgi:predicted phosphodiesterase
VTDGRRCTKCGALKPLHEFSSAGLAAKGGRYSHSRCKDCENQAARDRRARLRAEHHRAHPPVPLPDDEVTEPSGSPPAPMPRPETAPRCIVVIPDAHIPYHDRRAWAVVLEAVAHLRPTHVVIMGDFADCAALSQHERTTTGGESFEDEITAVNEALDKLGTVAGDADVTYVEGNHEFRLPRYIANVAPAINLTSLQPQNLYRVLERGWRWVPYQQACRIGPVTFTHDLERAGANAIRQALSDLRRSVVIGHLHRLGVWHEGDADGRHLFAACFGWLGDVDQLTYRHRLRARREWRHGFGVIWVDGDRVSPQAIPIVDGMAIVDGKRLTG